MKRLCIYCGARIKNGKACGAHAALLRLDPWHRPETVKGSEK